MLALTYRYRRDPDSAREPLLAWWMEICRSTFNCVLREIKDGRNSQKHAIDRCSLEKKYILPANLKFPTQAQQLNNLPRIKKEFPKLNEVPSQVLQQTIEQLHRRWEYFQLRGYGFPRFKKYGQFKSLLFPQFEENPVTNLHIRLLEIGAIAINLHCAIPNGFAVK